MTNAVVPMQTCGPKNPLVVGKIGQAFGVNGWVKLNSFCEPAENIVDYEPWWLKCRWSQEVGALEGLNWRKVDQSAWVKITVEAIKLHGKGFVTKFEGVTDRNGAEALRGCEVIVDRGDLPPLPKGEFYWHELEGLRVQTVEGQMLGIVREMMPTGANDVLVVQASSESIDERRRLIPYLPESVVKSINLDDKLLTVDWDADF